MTSIAMMPPSGLFATRPHPLPLAEIVQENYRIKSFIFEGEIPSAQPGQFVMAWLPGVGEKPFSLADNTPLTLTVAAVGPFTHALHTLQPGERVWFRGTYGRAFTTRGQHPVLVGGGYGAAPLAWLARTQLTRGQQPQVVLGGRTQADIFGVDHFEELGVPVSITTEDGSRGERGLATAPVRRLLADQKADSICAVGPHGMLHALDALATEYDVTAQLSWEAFMGCAIGLCGMCEHEDGSLLCLEGPVRETARAGPAQSS